VTSTGKRDDGCTSAAGEDGRVQAVEEDDLLGGGEEARRLAAVAQLAAGVAHDFNNIFTVVLGVAERLTQQSRLPKATREMLELIAQQGRRGIQLIRQLADFSRQAAGPDRAPLDLSALVAASAAELQASCGDRVQLSVSCPRGCGVRADVAHVRQILAHLVANGRDAMPDGGEIRIGIDRITGPRAVSRTAGLSEGDWIALSVADTGVGMSDSVRQRMFEPFFTTKDPGHGTGLGLAQVYGLVKQHGGFTDVVSRPGQGTVVTVYFPALEANSDQRHAVDDAGAALERGETILVVEDEAAVRAVLKWQFEGMGYRVQAAATGEEAVTLFAVERDTIGLAVIDWGLSGMGGAGLYRSLRAVAPTLPMLALSGYPPDVGVAQAGVDRDGRVQWLQKPVGLQALAQAVRRALAGTLGTVS